MRNQKGFSLVELLIVVAIIGIIAAVAIPSLLSARKAANESATIGNLRTMGSAEATALSLNGTYLSLDDLAADDKKYIDTAWATDAGKTRDSYTFASADVASTTFTVTATRTDEDASGTKDFNIVQDYVIREGTTAGEGNPIGQAAAVQAQ